MSTNRISPCSKNDNPYAGVKSWLLGCMVVGLLGSCSLIAKVKPEGLDTPKTKRSSEGGSSPRSRGPASSVVGGAPSVADDVEPPFRVVEMPEDLRVVPAEGARTVEPKAPTWCDVEFRPFPEHVAEAAGWLKGEVEDFPSMAALACTWPNDPNQQQWVASTIQELVNRIGITEAHVADYMRAKLVGGKNPNLDTNCPFSRSNMDTPEERKKKDTYSGVFCDRGISSLGNRVWEMDAREEVDIITRLSVMYKAAQASAVTWASDDERVYGDDVALANYAFFRKDAEQLDEEEFFAAASEFELTDVQKGNAVEIFFTTKKYFESLKLTYGRFAQRMPGFEVVAEKAPEKAYNQWVKDYKRNKRAMDDAFRIANASESERAAAMEGCAEKMTKAWVSFAKKRSHRTKDDIIESATHSVGYALLSALSHCETFNENVGVANSIGTLLQNSTLQRGPRTAAYRASYRALKEMKEASSNFPYSGKVMFGTSNSGELHTVPGFAQALDEAKGVVSSIQPDGDFATISFRRETVTEPVIECVSTGRIHYIASDGSIIYESNCRKTGTRRYEVTDAPVKIPKLFLGGIREGAYVKVQLQGFDRSRKGLPLEVFRSSAQERMVSYFGVPLG